MEAEQRCWLADAATERFGEAQGAQPGQARELLWLREPEVQPEAERMQQGQTLEERRRQVAVVEEQP